MKATEQQGSSNVSGNLIDPPALVRRAEDLEALAVAINADHQAGEASASQGLERFRAAEQKLIKAKEKCDHGRWLEWLKKNVKVKKSRVYQYIAFAKLPWCPTYVERLEKLTTRPMTKHGPSTPPPSPGSVAARDPLCARAGAGFAPASRSCSCTA